MIVKWKISPFMPPDEPDLVVWVNVGQVDKMWAATDPDFYVSAGGGGHTKPGSYARVGKAISQGEIMEMPQLSLDGSTLSFSDGRHRFAWCRDHGITALPVLAPPDCAEDLMKAVGESVPNPTDYRSIA